MTQRFRHLLPVVLGGDIGAYALARQLHEVTGTSVPACRARNVA